jgi:phage FluMu protein Com
MPEINLRDYRCENCNKLFFKGDVRHAIIEIKCRNCKQICRIECHGDNSDLPVGSKAEDTDLNK